MLTRSLYRGEITWNRTRKRNAWGIKRQTGRAEAEWVQLEVPALRIVPEPLWQAVRERFRDTRASYLRATNGQLWGRPANGIESPLPADGPRPVRALRREPHRAQPGFGRSADPRVPLQLPPPAREHGLSRRPGPPGGADEPGGPGCRRAGGAAPRGGPARACSRAINELNAPTDTVVPRRTALQAELTVLEQELARLAAAVAQGGDLKPLLDGIQAREQRRRALQTELAGLEGLQPVTARDLQDIQRDVEARLADWRGLLRRQVAQSRQILKKLLVGRIVFRQREDGVYEFSGQASLGRIIAGLACTKAVVAPYLKALRSQALSWSTVPSHSSLMLTRRDSPLRVGTGSAFRRRRLSHRFGPGTRPAVAGHPPSPRIVPFRRSHIFAVCAA